jgi:hypothetical protein
MILTEGRHHCPAHRDQRPSLSVRRSPDGRWLVYCFAGCPTEAILRAAGLSWADLFDTPTTPPRVPRRQPWRDAIETLLLARERRVQERLTFWVDVYRISDFIRTERQQLAAGRALASIVGDTEMVWAILEPLAQRERFINEIEAELDEALARYR